MITLVEAKNFRCLKYIRQPLGPFHILVGPNASGKTTFLDAITFLGQLIASGPDYAIRERTDVFQDLLWNRSGNCLELAIEASIPEIREKKLPDHNFSAIRYEIALTSDPEKNDVLIKSEKVLFKKEKDPHQTNGQRMFFPEQQLSPATILTSKNAKDIKTIVNKVPGGNDNFYSEVQLKKGKGWAPSFKLGPHKSAFGNLLDDEIKFPVSTWFKKYMIEGIQQIMLNSLLIRKASPPGLGLKFKTDGSNIPWVIDHLKQKKPDNFKRWIEHLQTALPDLQDIRTIERPDDKHRYLALQYHGGLEVPSWMASDGTLRLMALTLPAYLNGIEGVYLIEEPENGIHPKAVSTMYQSLSSVYEAQVLLATHSPVILGMAKPAQVLCFAKNSDGSTDIVSGDQHPKLREWQGETDLGTLFAGGVLG